MNIIILQQHDFIANNQALLEDERFLHIQHVLQANVGDSVRIGELNGRIGTGIIKHIGKRSITVDTCFTQLPPQKLPLTVILALPRPKMIRRIFRSIAELGVQELIVINSYKVEKSFWSSPALEEQSIQDYLLAGLQQAKDTIVPTVNFKRRFKPFVEDELPALIANTQAFVAHPGIGQHCPHAVNCPLTLAIGPEGGFTDYEVDKLITTGFSAIHLGQRVLRVENALTALVSKLYR